MKYVDRSKDELYQEIDNDSYHFYTHHVHIDKIETGTHQHRKAQLIYAEGGIVHIFINQRHWYLPARCYMWIPAQHDHAILSYSKNVDLYNFYFNVEPEEASFYTVPNIYFASDLLRELILYARNWEGTIDRTSKASYDLMQAIKSLLPELASKSIPFSIQHPFPKDEKLVEIASYLLKNIESNFTLAEVAQTFGLSVRTLSRKFKVHLGMSYIRFLRSLRITKALELISEKKFNMLEIALRVGYSSLSTFSTIFLKITGMRPTTYAQILNK